MISLTTLSLVAMVALPPLLLLALPILITEKLIPLKAHAENNSYMTRRS